MALPCLSLHVEDPLSKSLSLLYIKLVVSSISFSPAIVTLLGVNSDIDHHLLAARLALLSSPLYTLAHLVVNIAKLWGSSVPPEVPIGERVFILLLICLCYGNLALAWPSGGHQKCLLLADYLWHRNGFWFRQRFR